MTANHHTGHTFAASGTRIRSVSKAVRILTCLADHPGGMTARETALELSLPVATTHHLLNTLADESMVARDGRRRFHLGPMIAILGDALYRHVAPEERLLEPLRALGRSSGETVYLSGWWYDEVAVFAIFEGSAPVHVGGASTALSGHAHARSSGKALLALATDEQRQAYLASHALTALTTKTITNRRRLDADLRTTQRRGYAVDIEEYQDGVASVSAGVLEFGRAIGALTLSTPVERFHRKREAYVSAIVEAARSAEESGRKR